MEYMDEKIVKIRNQWKHEAHQNIYEEKVFVDDEELKFIEAELFSEAFSVMLPEKFVDMPFDVARVKYPSEQRPQIIRTSLNGAVNFCFSLFDMPFSNEQVYDTISGFQGMLQKMQPGNEYYGCSTETLGKMEIGWFDFKNYAIDTQIYSLMFVMPIHKKICSGVFNCPYRICEEWKPIMKQVLFSTKEIRKKEL